MIRVDNGLPKVEEQSVLLPNEGWRLSEDVLSAFLDEVSPDTLDCSSIVGASFLLEVEARAVKDEKTGAIVLEGEVLSYSDVTNPDPVDWMNEEHFEWEEEEYLLEEDWAEDDLVDVEV